MESKRNKDAENGLQVLTIITIMWLIGFFYWSRNGTILGYDAGLLPMLCCSSVNVLLTIVFIASWIFVRKENRIKDHLEIHFKTSNSVSSDEIATRFRMKKSRASRTIIMWFTESKIQADYDSKTGVFKLKEIEPTPTSPGKDCEDL
ncbi:MAG: hypothetical protein Q7J68_02470 [Thermoplasmata archaeon]|nr:hypothetical protein [Thermoplasmata archaeon]